MVFSRTPGRFETLAATVVESRIVLGAVTHFYVCVQELEALLPVFPFLVHTIPQKTEVAGMRFAQHKSAFGSDLMPWCFFQGAITTNSKGLFLPCIYAYRDMEILLLYSFSTVERFYWLFLAAKIICAYCNM